MKISLRATVGLVAAAVLATGLVTGVTVASALGDPGGGKPPRTDQSTDAAQAAADHLYEAGSTLVYVPITPCRIVDTRAGGGRLAANSTREFYVGGDTGFAGQGGKSGGCGIPAAAAAVTVSLTSTQPSGAGRVVAYPAAVSAPVSTMLSYGATGNATSTPTVALTPGTARQMEVKNSVASVHLVIDVLGFYIPQYSAYVNSDGTFWLTSGGVSSTRVDVGVYEIAFDSDISYCNGVASTGVGGFTVGVFPWEGVATVEITDADGVPADSAFNLVIVC